MDSNFSSASSNGNESGLAVLIWPAFLVTFGTKRNVDEIAPPVQRRNLTENLAGASHFMRIPDFQRFQPAGSQGCQPAGPTMVSKAQEFSTPADWKSAIQQVSGNLRYSSVKFADAIRG